MKSSILFDDRIADLLLQAQGIEAVRGILARRGASRDELEAHTRALESVRHQLAEKLAA
ncbi:MAG TPA: hypothetical protein VGU02_07970 [Gaiellaceae bacterium]|nr:hypothetical protein [Gaiellaceae bacterium]